jgi:clan AA aspartic protease
MITGTVTTARQPMIPLVLRDPAGTEHTLQALIDTGFNGWLGVPPDLIPDLGLPWLGRDTAVLADNSAKPFDFYGAVIWWDGTLRRVVAIAAEGPPLVGMAMLDGYELRIQATPRGLVTITALS